MSSEDFFEKEKLNIGRMESELFLFVVNDMVDVIDYILPVLIKLVVHL